MLFKGVHNNVLRIPGKGTRVVNDYMGNLVNVGSMNGSQHCGFFDKQGDQSGYAEVA